uniref:Probable DNA polymerase n=2 Tax=unclassified Termitomyces TaxID=2634893 RepID=A0A8H2S9V3_9AGAR|nr:DNA polymerase [Termitomyces sp. T60a]QWO71419.1 DNA polymerase [Termitomyces sp. T99]
MHKNTNLLKKNNYIYFEEDRKILLKGFLKNSLNYDRITKSEINGFFKDKKDIKLPLALKKGFRGYSVFIYKEAFEYNQSDTLLKCLQELFSGLEEGKIYSLLINVANSENLTTVSLLPRSILVTCESPVEVLTEILLQHLIIIESKYDIFSPINLVIQGREWYSKEDIINQIKKKNNIDTSSKNLGLDEIELKECNRKYDTISKLVTEELYSLLHLEKDSDVKFLTENFNKLKKSCIEINLTPSKIEKLKVITGDFSYTLYSYREVEKEINSNLLCFHHSNDKNIYLFIEDGYIKSRWVDFELEGKEILRLFGNNKVIFSLKREIDNKNLIINSKINNIELGYNFNSFKQSPKERIIDQKIGVIDLETFTCDDKGTQQVYAGGWIVDNVSKLYYLDEFEKLDSTKLVRKLFLDIIKSDYYNYTFFVHNLSGFDYIFIFDSLTKESSFEEGYNFKLKPIIKDDNTLISLKISAEIVVKKNVTVFKEDGDEVEEVKFIKEKRSITLLDSSLFLPNTLRKLALDFSCSVDKGYFPYTFVNKYNFLYKGKTPNVKYFTELSDIDYIKLFPEGYIFDLREECLKYLKKDLITLLEIMKKFSQSVYEHFGINITTCKTISGLSLKIYLSNFYKLGFNFKEIKGRIESEIRKAYFGGMVVLNKKGKLFSKDNLGYFYDYNSFFPSLMLRDLPVGNPTLSYSKDLNSFFGFCYAKITPPPGLDNYLIPYRDPTGKVYCPSKPFFGLYWSELLKASREYGYEINVIGGFNFEKGKKVFNSFVRDIYEKRLEAKKKGLSSLQYIFKLILNSLYGRMGMKDLENKLEIVDKDKADILLSKKNITFYADMGDMCIIKYNKNINPNILKLVKENSSQDLDKEHVKMDYLANIFKERGVSSSIPIAAAITSYALIDLMKYKNIKDNKLIYSDTDSVLMEKPLDSKLISSTDLGKLKLEYVISEGYFISPKFYGFKDVLGNTVIKTKGVTKGKIVLEDLIKLSQGENINLKTTVFVKNFKEGTVNIRNQDYLIKGVELK